MGGQRRFAPVLDDAPAVEAEDRTPATKLIAPKAMTVDSHCWGQLYVGTEQQLVSTGLVKPEWFPGKPGNGDISQAIALGEDDEPMLLRNRAINSRRFVELIKIRKLSKSNNRFEIRHSYKQEPHFKSSAQKDYRRNLYTQELRRRMVQKAIPLEFHGSLSSGIFFGLNKDEIEGLDAEFLSRDGSRQALYLAKIAIRIATIRSKR